MKTNRFLVPAALLSLGACALHGPQAPLAAPGTPAWRETPPGWMTAAPADTLARGPWWTLFGDTGLNASAPQVAVSNQNVAAAAAAVELSRATVREQRAGFFPTLSLQGGATRADPGNGKPANQFSPGLGVSWEPDLWGSVRGSVSAATATAQASEAELAGALLSAQTAFVTDYLAVREADAEIALLRDTIAADKHSLDITRARYDAAIAPRSDVLQAQTTLATSRSQLAAEVQQRAQLLHAMAVLAGQPPASFRLPAGDWQADVVPAVPVDVPADLLQRRPDIAGAERRVAAANAQVGVARAAWFPALTLSANGSQASQRLGSLFDVSALSWSLGASLAQAIFDGGARTARVDEARATWTQAVATYRQTVLAAFSDVEDELAAADSLAQQEMQLRVAALAAEQTLQETTHRYEQGIVAYTDVVAAQATALGARRSLLQSTLGRQTAAVALIGALGGGWEGAAAH